MRTNPLKTRLANGDPCRGIWLSLPSVAGARLLARLPCDWLMVDAEHSPLDVSTLTGIIAAIADAGGPAPLVRLAAGDVENVKRALDAGAWGVVAPMINTRAEAEQVVAAARFPPQGSRSFGSLWAALAFATDSPTYVRAVNDQILVGVQIETVAALRNLDAILSTPGLDLAFVGPVDLSLSMGLDPIPEQPAPLFQEAMTFVLETARRHKVPVGIFCSTGQAAAARIRQGFPFVNVGTDLGALLRGLTAELEAGQQTGDPAAPP
jgi:4-hydroxy-2-oxoheptanedioate aldolase